MDGLGDEVAIFVAEGDGVFANAQGADDLLQSVHVGLPGAGDGVIKDDALAVFKPHVDEDDAFAKLDRAKGVGVAFRVEEGFLVPAGDPFVFRDEIIVGGDFELEALLDAVRPFDDDGVGAIAI